MRDCPAIVGVETMNILRRAKGPGPGDGERDRIALAVHVTGVAVYLIEKQVAHRHRPQTNGRVGAGNRHDAAAEILGQHGVATIAAASRFHDPTKRRRLLYEWRNALLAVAPPHVHRRPDHQHGAGRMVHHVADPIYAGLGGANLGALHEHDALRR